jgi:hypothetical protein
MARKKEWDYESLAWIHRVREEHYRQTRTRRLEDWLRPVDLDSAARDCRSLGLKVRPVEPRGRKAG